MPVSHLTPRSSSAGPTTDNLLARLQCVPSAKLAVNDGIESLTYAELLSRARRAATAIKMRHGTDGYLLLRASPTAGFVASFLGVIYSGNTPIPVDPELPESALALVASRSRALGLLEPLGPADLAVGAECNDLDPSRPALVMFTSGTTGQPKGAVISHANLLHSCDTIADYLDYHRHASAAVVLPLHYSYALLSQVCAQLVIGGSVHLFSDIRNPLKFAARVAAEGIETFCGVPSTYHALCAFHALKPLRVDSIRVLCSAGAAMDRGKLQTVKTIFPAATFFNNYGMTEAAPRIAYIREDDSRFGEPTCGRPMAGVEVKIVHPDTHESLPDGMPGVLAVRGPNIAAGYLNDPEATTAAFTRDGFLLSGDVAHLDGGYIFIRGRHDDVFNSGGEKVAPLEIEHVLNRVAGVDLAAVAGLPDEARGAVPVAFVQLNRPVSRKELVAAASAELSKTKVPQRYYEVSSFPMTSSGKLQRKMLVEDAAPYVIREIV